MYKPYDIEVEYLESNGTQWINSLYCPNNSTKIEAKGMYTHAGTYGSNYMHFMYGVRETIDSNLYQCDYLFNYYASKQDNACVFGHFDTGEYYDYDFRNIAITTVNDITGGYIDGTKIFSQRDSTQQFQFTQPLYILWCNIDGTGQAARPPYGRIYYLKVYENDALIHDFIPVRIKNVGYLYDKVTKQMFENSGTGNFTLGPDLYDAEVEYLESTGTQYINTGINISNNIKFGLDILSQNETLGNFFGARQTTSSGMLTLFTKNESGATDNGIRYQYGTKTAYIANHKLIDLNTRVNFNNITDTKTFIYDNYTTSYSAAAVANTFSVALPIYLFAMNNNGTPSYSSYRCYCLKLINGSTVVRDLVPVRKGNVGYMYDRVSKQLFENEGTGDFIIGPDHYDAEIEYLELDKNQRYSIVTNIQQASGIGFGCELSHFKATLSTAGSGYPYLVGFNRGNPDRSQFYIKGTNSSGAYTTGTINLDWQSAYYRLNIVISGNNKQKLEIKSYSSSKMRVYIDGVNKGDYNKFVPSSAGVLSLLSAGQIYEGRIYHLFAYDENNNYLLDAIPVRVGNVGYMYDKVSGKLFGNSSTGSFILGPDIYDSKVEYIQSTGIQWIDSEVNYDSTISMMTNMRINNTANRTLLGIYYNNGTVYRWNAYTTTSTNRLYAYFGTITNKYITISLNTWYTLILDNQYLNANGSLLDSTATAFTIDNPVSIYIFGRHQVQPQSGIDVADSFGACFLRYMKIWRGTTLVRDFIPVRKGDVGYLYDKISNRLFDNAGVGRFVLGRDVDPIPTTFDAPVQYIKFTGHQFIDTGIYGNLSTKISLRYYPTSYNLTQNILCTSNNTSNSICFGRGSGARWQMRFNNGYMWHITFPSPYGNNWFDAILSNTIRQIKAPNKTGCIKDETEVLTEFTTPDTLILGAHAGGYTAGWNNYRGYIGAFQIRQGGLLVRDYIPVRKDGVGYLYDRVTESMFGNDGVETIGYGPDNLQPMPVTHGEGTTRYYTRRDIIQMNQEQVYNCVVSWQSNDTNTSTTAQLYHGQRYKYEDAWGDISGTNFTFWATSYTGRHKTLNVKAGQKYKIKTDIVQATVLVFCNDHVWTSRKKLTGIQSVTITAGTEAVITVPSGYNYMMIRAATSSGSTLTLPDRITRLVAYG